MITKNTKHKEILYILFYFFHVYALKNLSQVVMSFSRQYHTKFLFYNMGLSPKLVRGSSEPIWRKLGGLWNSFSGLLKFLNMPFLFCFVLLCFCFE